MEAASEIKCNLCGGTEFEDVKSRKKVRCTGCRSVERTRLLWMYLQEVDFGPDTKVLHLAPERGLYRKLNKRVAPGNYVCSDINPKRYGFVENIVRLDLCDLDAQPSAQYDIIIHSHVMEHVPCNIAYTLFHLHRMLKPGGRQICIIPFASGKYDECFQDISPEERTRRFGQHDHVRRFGAEDRQRHLGSIVRLPDEFDAKARFGARRLRAANIPAKAWQGFTVNTVLTLGKEDIRLKAEV